MSTIEKTVDVNVPVHTAYNQWTQFEEFPRFMDGVEEVRQLDDTHLHWRAKIGGKAREWDAEITQQVPDERIEWHSIEGPRQDGYVTFHRVDDDVTRVLVHMDYDPEGLVEKAADLVNVTDRRVEGDLRRFKEMIESRATETGAWRGEVDQPPSRGEPGVGGNGGVDRPPRT